MFGTKAVPIGNGKFIANEAIAPGTAQVVTAASASSTMSAAVGSQTRIILVESDVSAFIAVGSSVTANRSTCLHVPANNPMKLVVSPSDKVAVIADTAVGRLFICEAVMIPSS